MSDIQQTSTTPPASTPATNAAPVAASVTPTAPSGTESITPSASATEAVTPVTATSSDTKPADAPASAESILGGDNVKETPKEPAPADAAKLDGKDTASKPESKPEGDTAPEGEKVFPTYEPLKLPENLQVDSEQMQEFDKLIGEIESSKLDHKGFEETRQKLADMHIKGVTESINRLNDYYVQLHEQQKSNWLDAFKNDPEIGGENIAKVTGNLRSAVETYGGNEAQIAEFRELMKTTGVGNNPALIRLLHNMDAKIRKYETEGGDIRMVPAARPAPVKIKPHQLFYTGT